MQCNLKMGIVHRRRLRPGVRHIGDDRSVIGGVDIAKLHAAPEDEELVPTGTSEGWGTRQKSCYEQDCAQKLAHRAPPATPESRSGVRNRTAIVDRIPPWSKL